MPPDSWKKEERLYKEKKEQWPIGKREKAVEIGEQWGTVRRRKEEEENKLKSCFMIHESKPYILHVLYHNAHRYTPTHFNRNTPLFHIAI